MARVRVSSMTVHPDGVGTIEEFVVAAIKRAATHEGANITMVIKGLPFRISSSTDAAEAALEIETATGLIRGEAISLYGSNFGREIEADTITSIYFKAD